jgi:hypothetical protein
MMVQNTDFGSANGAPGTSCSAKSFTRAASALPIGHLLGQVMVPGFVEGSAVDDGHATIEAAPVAMASPPTARRQTSRGKEEAATLDTARGVYVTRSP